MIIRSSGRRRVAAKWHGPFTPRSYGATDDHVATFPVCVPLSAAHVVGRCQRWRGRQGRVLSTDHASSAGGVPLQLCQVRHMAERGISAQRGLVDHRCARRGPVRNHTRRNHPRQNRHGQETGRQAIREHPRCSAQPHSLPQHIRGEPSVRTDKGARKDQHLDSQRYGTICRTRRNGRVHGGGPEGALQRQRGGRGARGSENGITASEISQDRQRQATDGKLNPMRAFRELSIRQKLTMMGILATSTAILLACTAFLTYELFAYRGDMIRSLFTQAEIVGANSASAILFNDDPAAAETLAALKADPHIVSAGIYTRDSRAFAVYGRSDKQRAVALRERFV